VPPAGEQVTPPPFSLEQRLEPKVFNLNGAVADLSKMLQRRIGEDAHFTSFHRVSETPAWASSSRTSRGTTNPCRWARRETRSATS
jgi:hypothetical protein